MNFRALFYSKSFGLGPDLSENKDIYNKMANAKNPYGDGHASDRIINDIVYYFSDKSGPRPKDF